MRQKQPPLRFQPSSEVVPTDGDVIQRGLTEAMLSIQRKTHADTGHARRAVHAKPHGCLRARFEVFDGLSPQLARGLFATPATCDAVLRFSTTPGDVLDDEVSPPAVPPELTALSREKLDLSGRPDAIRETVRDHFRTLPAAREQRVQVGTDIDAMLVEDAAAEWPEDRSPCVAMARVTALPQDSWSDDLRDLVEEHLAFDPRVGLAAHRPLGSIMRARRPACAAARDDRGGSDGAEIREPAKLPAR